MSMKEHIERSPFVYFISAVIGAVSITIAVDSYFWSKRLDSIKSENQITIARYEDRLASIERRIGSNTVFDVTSFLIDRTNQSRISSTSRFFSDWEFYASNDESYWIHEFIRKDELSLKVLEGERSGIGETYSETIRKSKRYLESPLIHVWTAKNPPNVFVGPVRLFPYILVERITISDYLAKEGIESSSYLGDIVDRFFFESWADMEKQFENYSNILSPKDRSKRLIEKMEILSLEKFGAVFYAQGLITFNMIEVDGVIHDHYFQRSEFLFVSMPNHIFKITAVVFGEDPAPRGESYSRLMEWFSDLAILVN